MFTEEENKIISLFYSGDYELAEQLMIATNNVKLVDNDLSISCEIDILHHNPEDKTIEVTECKTYNGANIYAAKDILGDTTNFPKPKDQNLLQCVKYLLTLQKYSIQKINLLYLDRSCSGVYNNKQFVIYLDKLCRV